jgi:hypothetical protein
MAIGFGSLRLHDAEVAAGATHVLDVNGAKERLHPLGPLPGDDVVNAAG